MKKHLGIIAFLLFAYAHAAQNPFQRAELIRHPITGDTVRVFDILVRIDSADVDGLLVQDSLEKDWWRMAAVCEDEFSARRLTDTTYHPWGLCYQGYIEKTFKLFADWLYEATNGKHLLGKVHFVKDFVDSSHVDVEWISNRGSGCKDNTSVPDAYGRRGSNSCASGLGAWGNHATEPGIKQVHREKYDDNRLMSPTAIAATLTHEWGHYVLGLDDEYAGGDGYTIIDPGKYRNLLVNPDKPISTPLIGSEWRWDAPELIDSVWTTIVDFDSASKVLGRAMSEAPSLMYHQWVTDLGDEGSMRYANLSTDYMHCEEGANASAIGHCTPRTFYGEYGVAKVKRVYGLSESAWGKISKPDYRWSELASAAPTYNDRDSRGNRYVKMDSTSANIMRAFLELDWSLWNADTSSLSFSRTVLFLVDLSKYASEDVQREMVRALEVATLFAKNVPGINIGLEAVASRGNNHVTVPIGSATDVADSILAVLGTLKFEGNDCESQELFRPCDFMDLDLGAYGIRVLEERPATERKHLVFLTSGHLHAMGFVPWEEIYGVEMEEAGIRLHVENFLDSAGQLSETFSASRLIRMSTGSSAYNIADRPESEADNLIMFLSNVLGVQAKKTRSIWTNLSSGWQLVEIDKLNLATIASNVATPKEWCSGGWTGISRLKGDPAPYYYKFEFSNGNSLNYRPEVEHARLASDSMLLFTSNINKEECLAEIGRVNSDKDAISYNALSWIGPASVVASGNTTAMSRLYAPPGMANLLPCETLLLHYEIGGDELLAGVSPRAEICDIYRPESKCDTVFLRDDGKNGDDYAGDGRYVLQWSGYKTSGPFRVEVVVNSLPPEAHWVGIEGGAIRKAEPDEFAGESSLFHFAILGEVENADTSAIEPVLPKLKVSARDHHFGHPQISVLSFKVENVGETPLEGAMLHYFFTMPEATPYLLDYYTPDFDPQIVDHGEGRYELRMPLVSDLAPGAIMPVGMENQLHLRGTNYETLNVLDDWSNPKSVTFVETDSVVVTDKNGTIVLGVAPEWWTTGGVQ
ncbi:MAG: hypothetical protein J6Y56_04105 [Fibrobacterales bacterium]|nr:hypothetical protein [Fibrobacterales bacterium]